MSKLLFLLLSDYICVHLTSPGAVWFGPRVGNSHTQSPLRDQGPLLCHQHLQHRLAWKVLGNEMVRVLGEPCGPVGRGEDVMAGTGLDLHICCVQPLRSGDRLGKEQQQGRKTFHAENLDVSLRNNRKGSKVFPSWWMRREGFYQEAHSAVSQQMFENSRDEIVA